MSTFDTAVPAPRGLLYLATFNAAERAVIAASPELQHAIRNSAPAEWSSIVETHREAQRQSLISTRSKSQATTGDANDQRQVRYVGTILDRELQALANMQRGSGRNDAAFRLVCRVGRWAHHGILSRDQLIADVLNACQRNGLMQEDGRKAVLDTIASGLAKSAADPLPELGARHG